MLDLTTLGYKYPIKAQIFGNSMKIIDAVNRVIFMPEPYTGGYVGREKMQKVMAEIAEMFNANQPKEEGLYETVMPKEMEPELVGAHKIVGNVQFDNLIPTAQATQSFTEKDFIANGNGKIKRGRGRPRKV